MPDKQGRIWFGKDQDGIDIWNKATGETVSLTYDVDVERGLPNNTINVLYEDEGGVMWIGTYKKSVAYYDEGINMIIYLLPYVLSPEEPRLCKSKL